MYEMLIFTVKVVIIPVNQTINQDVGVTHNRHKNRVHQEQKNCTDKSRKTLEFFHNNHLRTVLYLYYIDKKQFLQENVLQTVEKCCMIYEVIKNKKENLQYEYIIRTVERYRLLERDG